MEFSHQCISHAAAIHGAKPSNEPIMEQAHGTIQIFQKSRNPRDSGIPELFPEIISGYSGYFRKLPE